MASEIHLHGKSCEHFFHLNILCTEEGIESFTKTIREKKIEKIVFAGCSPLQNQELFGSIADQAGLTPSAIYGVNIKEQIFLHANNKEQSLNRAIGSIQKALHALSEIPAFDTQKVPLHQDVLIIGGGIAGISAAQEIHRLGYSTTVIERTEKIGGRFEEAILLEDEYLSPKIQEQWDLLLKELSGVNVFTGSVLIELSGNIGNFFARINTPEGEKTVRCGALIVASGSCVPAEVSKSSHIISISDINLAIADLAKRKGLRSLGLVLDMNIDETKASTELAFTLAKSIQGRQRYQAYLFCRDVRVAVKELELLYDEVREAGVNIIKYNGQLSFRETDRGVFVNYIDSILSREMTLYCDRIALSPFGLSVSADPDLAEITGLSTDAYGQLQDNNIHLFPEQTNRPGIFVIGACRGQYYVPQVISEAKAAALEVHALLSQKFLEIELSNAAVDADKCILCLTCIRSCPYKAMQVSREKGAAESIPEVCQKCGICAGECPAKAIELPLYSDKVILSYVNAYSSS